jgi:hypothetical protein
MNVQTKPAAVALAPLKSGQQDDRSFGISKTDNAIQSKLGTPCCSKNSVAFAIS